jgi:uncharacterized protein
MPVTVSYPGVYIEEIPSGVRTITGVATSITAFLGRSLRGPVDKATTINSFGDFERIFGGLAVDSSMSFAVRDFYLNGGSQAVIVRMFHADPVFADDPARKIEFDKAHKVAVEVAAKATGADAKAAVDNAWAEANTHKAGGDVEWAAAKAVTQAAEKANVKGATPSDINAAATKAVDEAAGKAAPFAKARLTIDNLDLEAADPGAWGNLLRARVDHNTRDPLPAEAPNSLFNLFVRDGQTGEVEELRNLSITVGHPREVKKVLSESKLVRMRDASLAARPQPSGTTVDKNKGIWDDNASPTNSKVTTDFASDGTVLGDSELTGNENGGLGLYALKKVDLFNLLCIPPYSDKDVSTSVIDAAAAFCKQRRAFLLIDPPLGWSDKDKAVAGIDTDVGAPTSYAAIFFPRLRRPNPLRSDAEEDFVPCGAVAGIFARTDTQRGVWKAPAGLEATLVGVPSLSVKLTDLENGELNPLGIDCLRAMPAAGRVVWGARTRLGDNRLASEWKYTPVRRTALFIEESLYRGTQWVVFEPNDEPLWAQIRLNVGAFMNNLFRQGAFQGKSPREAYLVKCDKETTTQNDINLGIVNIVVGFAPLKPAEFVILKIQQLAGQIET